MRPVPRLAGPLSRAALVVIALAALAPAGIGAPVAERPLPAYLQPDEANTVQVFQRASPAVVNVSTVRLEHYLFSMDVSEVPAGTGTGFVWDDKGHIVTNFHVIQDANKVVVSFKNGKTSPARLVAAEARKDIAVLKVDLPPDLTITPLPVANSSGLLVGQKAIAIGNPFGLDQTLTRGVVSALGRSIAGVGGVTIRDMIQTDASINPGNSGGPLLDSRGMLIGMNTMIYSQSGSSAGVGFAVPANTITRIVNDLIRYGRVKQPGIGITAFDESVTQRLGVRGVLLMDVTPGGPAAQAGLVGTQRSRRGEIVLGDLLVSIAGQPLANYDDLYNTLDGRKIGDTVPAIALRGGRQRTVTLRLADVSDLR